MACGPAVIRSCQNPVWIWLVLFLFHSFYITVCQMCILCSQGRGACCCVVSDNRCIGYSLFHGCLVAACTMHGGVVGGFVCVTRRKLQTPGIAEEHKRQETPTINPIGTTDTPHTPSNKHYRKDSPGDAQHQLTQQPCTRQHNNNPPSSPTPDRVITRCFQSTQPAAKPRSNTGGLAEQAG